MRWSDGSAYRGSCYSVLCPSRPFVRLSYVRASFCASLLQLPRRAPPSLSLGSLAIARTCPESCNGEAPSLTQAVSHILTEVEQLSAPERAELRRAIVERVPMSDALTDEDFAAFLLGASSRLDKPEIFPFRDSARSVFSGHEH